jgi:hypothetical protein
VQEECSTFLPSCRDNFDRFVDQEVDNEKNNLATPPVKKIIKNNSRKGETPFFQDVSDAAASHLGDLRPLLLPDRSVQTYFLIS